MGFVLHLSGSCFRASINNFDRAIPGSRLVPYSPRIASDVGIGIRLIIPRLSSGLACQFKCPRNSRPQTAKKGLTLPLTKKSYRTLEGMPSARPENPNVSMS